MDTNFMCKPATDHLENKAFEEMPQDISDQGIAFLEQCSGNFVWKCSGNYIWRTKHLKKEALGRRNSNAF